MVRKIEIFAISGFAISDLNNFTFVLQFCATQEHHHQSCKRKTSFNLISNSIASSQYVWTR